MDQNQQAQYQNSYSNKNNTIDTNIQRQSHGHNFNSNHDNYYNAPIQNTRNNYNNVQNLQNLQKEKDNGFIPNIARSRPESKNNINKVSIANKLEKFDNGINRGMDIVQKNRLRELEMANVERKLKSKQQMRESTTSNLSTSSKQSRLSQKMLGVVQESRQLQINSNINSNDNDNDMDFHLNIGLNENQNYNN